MKTKLKSLWPVMSRALFASSISWFCAGVSISCTVFTLVMTFKISPEMRQLRNQLKQAQQQLKYTSPASKSPSDPSVDPELPASPHHGLESSEAYPPTSGSVRGSELVLARVSRSQTELMSPAAEVRQRRLPLQAVQEALKSPRGAPPTRQSPCSEVGSALSRPLCLQVSGAYKLSLANVRCAPTGAIEKEKEMKLKSLWPVGAS